MARKTKEELEKELKTVYGKLNEQEMRISDLLNSIFYILETKSKKTLFGDKYIFNEVLLKELSRVNLSKEITSPTLKRIYTTR